MGISANGREMVNGRRRGGECCGYQGRKKRKTTNAIYVTDSQGIPLVISTPVSGSHNNVYNISEVLSELFSGLTPSALSVSGLFLNADAGFDTEQFRRGCYEHEVFPNVAFSKRRGKQREEEFLDELLYKQRYCIERTNAWMDSYRSVLNRFDTTLSSLEGMELYRIHTNSSQEDKKERKVKMTSP